MTLTPVTILGRAAAVLLTVLLASATASAKEFTFEYQRIIEPEGEITLDLTYREGDVEVVGSEDGRLIIEATKHVHAVSMDEAEAVQAHIEIKVDQQDDVIRVLTNYLKMRNRGESFWQKIFGGGGKDSYGEVHWRIALPTFCDIRIVNAGGRVDVRNVRGSVQIESSAADIALSSVEGNVAVRNSLGRTKGELIYGDVDIRQPQGQIALDYVEGNIVVRSVSAEITIRQDRGAIDVTTATGSVEIQTPLNSVEDCYVETESGNVKLLIPDVASGELDITSESGEIKTEMPIAIKSMTRKQVIGEFGYGGVKVSITSISGDVTVVQY